LQHVLPCEQCTIHYQNNLETIPLNDKVMSGRKSLVLWLVKIHNEVNRMNNKKLLTTRETIENYHDMYKPDTIIDFITKNIDTILLILLLIIFILVEQNRIFGAVCNTVCRR